jgi:hypothetical protein
MLRRVAAGSCAALVVFALLASVASAWYVSFTVPKWTQPCYHCYFNIYFRHDSSMTSYWRSVVEQSRTTWNGKPTAPILREYESWQWAQNFIVAEWVPGSWEGHTDCYPMASDNTKMHHFILYINRAELQTTSWHWDLSVATHELGHAQGAGHISGESRPFIMKNVWWNGDEQWLPETPDVEYLQWLYPIL